LSKKVAIPDELYQKLLSQVDVSEFTDVEELVLYVLQDYLDKNVVIKDVTMSKDEEKILRKRLEDLGYM
jgi:hypothetical protein